MLPDTINMGSLAGYGAMIGAQADHTPAVGRRSIHEEGGVHLGVVGKKRLT